MENIVREAPCENDEGCENESKSCKTEKPLDEAISVLSDSVTAMKINGEGLGSGINQLVAGVEKLALGIPAHSRNEVNNRLHCEPGEVSTNYEEVTVNGDEDDGLDHLQPMGPGNARYSDHQKASSMVSFLAGDNIITKGPKRLFDAYDIHDHIGEPTKGYRTNNYEMNLLTGGSVTLNPKLNPIEHLSSYRQQQIELGPGVNTNGSNVEDQVEILGTMTEILQEFGMDPDDPNIPSMDEVEILKNTNDILGLNSEVELSSQKAVDISVMTSMSTPMQSYAFTAMHNQPVQRKHHPSESSDITLFPQTPESTESGYHTCSPPLSPKSDISAAVLDDHLPEDIVQNVLDLEKQYSRESNMPFLPKSVESVNVQVTTQQPQPICTAQPVTAYNALRSSQSVATKVQFISRNTNPSLKKIPTPVRPILPKPAKIAQQPVKMTSTKQDDIKPATAVPSRILPDMVPEKRKKALAAKEISSKSLDELLMPDNDGDMWLHAYIYNMSRNKDFAYLIHALLHRLKRAQEDNLLVLKDVINRGNKQLQTSVYMATIENQPVVLQWLLKLGGDPNRCAIEQTNQSEQRRKGPLHYAVSYGDEYYDVLNVLLDRVETNVNLPNSDGLTPLHVAAKQHGKRMPGKDIPINNQRIIVALIHKGGDLQCGDGSGKTPIHYIIETQDYNLMREIFNIIPKASLKNYLNKQTYDMSTALHVATTLVMPNRLEEHKRIVRLLMENGADPNIKNVTHRTAGQIAYKAHREELNKMLKTTPSRSPRQTSAPVTHASNSQGSQPTIIVVQVPTPQSSPQGVTGHVQHTYPSPDRAILSTTGQVINPSTLIQAVPVQCTLSGAPITQNTVENSPIIPTTSLSDIVSNALLQSSIIQPATTTSLFSQSTAAPAAYGSVNQPMLTTPVANNLSVIYSQAYNSNAFIQTKTDSSSHRY